MNGYNHYHCQCHPLVQNEVGPDQHEVGELVALAKEAPVSDLVGQSTQSSSGHQHLNLSSVLTARELVLLLSIESTISPH